MTPLVKTAVVVFARAAEAESKGLMTSAPRSARLSELLVRRSLQTIGQAPAGVDLVLATDGPLPIEDATALVPGRVVHFISQEGEGFEARILGALERARDLGYERLVVVGIDTPSMSARDLRRAVESAHPVLGPSRDGGFYLLGLDAAHLDRLRGLPWCTADLSGALSMRFAELHLERTKTRSDLDRRADVLAQHTRLARLALRLLGRPLEAEPSQAPRGFVAAPRSFLVKTSLASRGPPARAPHA